MHFLDIVTCRDADRKQYSEMLTPFRAVEFGYLVSTTASPNRVTLLKSAVTAQLTDTDSATILAVNGKKYDYRLRIMSNCVHVTVRGRGWKRPVATACISTIEEVTTMLETIVHDSQDTAG